MPDKVKRKVREIHKNQRYQKYPIPKRCDVCKSKKVNLVQEHVNRNGNNVFRASYVCEKCGASVGIHSGGKFPMGKMATKEMREMRYKIHRLLEEFNFTDKE